MDCWTSIITGSLWDTSHSEWLAGGHLVNLWRRSHIRTDLQESFTNNNSANAALLRQSKLVAVTPILVHVEISGV